MRSDTRFLILSAFSLTLIGGCNSDKTITTPVAATPATSRDIGDESARLIGRHSIMF